MRIVVPGIVAVMWLLGAIAWTRTEPSLAVPDSAAAIASAAAADARSPDADTTTDAATDASDASAEAEAGAHVDPCARCRVDEFCAVTRKVPGVQRGGPLAVPWTTTVTCEKLPMPACARRSCACLDMQQASCSLRDGKLRVERRINLP